MTSPAPDTGSRTDTDSGPDAPSSAGRPRRLYRLTDEGRWAGVAAGLGWYLGIDPVLFRIGFVVAGFATGPVALGAYVLLWMILPARTVVGSGLPTPPPSDTRTRGLTAVGIVIALVALGAVDALRGEVVVAAGLIGLGVLLFLDGDRRPGRPSRRPEPEAHMPAGASGGLPPPPVPPRPVPPPPPRPPGTDVPTPPEVQRSSAYDQPYAAAWTADGRTHVAPAPRRPRSRVGAVTVALLLLSLGVTAFLDRAGVVDLTPTRVAGMVVLAAGLGLLAGTVLGRPRGLIALGLLGSLVLVALHSHSGLGLPVSPDAGVGERHLAPRTVTEAQTGAVLFAGEVTIDLRSLEPGGRGVDVPVRMGVGELTVVVPQDATVDADVHIRWGDATVLGDRDTGDVDLALREPRRPGARHVTLDVDLGFGEVTIRRAGDPAAAEATTGGGPR